MKPPRLDPIAMAKLKRAHRCPHCDSNVAVRTEWMAERGEWAVNVYRGHEEGCLAADAPVTELRRAEGEDNAAWLDAVVAAAEDRVAGPETFHDGQHIERTDRRQ